MKNSEEKKVVEAASKMKQRQRDIEFFTNFKKGNALRGTFFCYLVFFCFAFTVFYRSTIVNYNLKGRYGRIIEAFGALGPTPEAFWCNRSDRSTDVCHMSGDVHLTTGDVRRVTLHSRLKQMRLSFSAPALAVNCSERSEPSEWIRPYARKSENSTMNLVESLELKCADANSSTKSMSRAHLALTSGMGVSCLPNLTHSAPGLLFSSGGFSGNPYHDFQETIIPLYITAQHLHGEVVLIISDIRPFWMQRWHKVLQHLSRYPLVNIQESSGEHCFPEMTVGLYTHNVVLGLAPSLMPHNESTEDFQRFLRAALAPDGLEAIPSAAVAVVFPTSLRDGKVPKLLIIQRERTRLLMNVGQIRDMALGMGFDVQVATLRRNHDLQMVYKWYQSSDVVIGVHGSELAYMLFMPKKSVLIQIVVLSTDWPSDFYYGQGTCDALGLHYIEYKIQPNESSLADKYGVTDKIVTDPRAITSQGWDYEWKYYFTEQSVHPDLGRFKEALERAKKLVSDSQSAP